LLDAEGKPVTPEKAREIIGKARAAQPVEITGAEIPANEDLKEYRKNALEYGMSLRGDYINKDTGKKIILSRGKRAGGIKEMLQHDYKDIPHLASVAAIPGMIRDGIFIASIENEDRAKHPDIAAYDYYLAGLKFGTKDFTVKMAVATDIRGSRYYDHKLTEIEKGKFLDPASWVTNPPAGQGPLELDRLNDKRLVSILSSLFQTGYPSNT
jgi:hypothetical protein